MSSGKPKFNYKTWKIELLRLEKIAWPEIKAEMLQILTIENITTNTINIIKKMLEEHANEFGIYSTEQSYNIIWNWVGLNRKLANTPSVPKTKKLRQYIQQPIVINTSNEPIVINTSNEPINNQLTSINIQQPEIITKLFGNNQSSVDDSTAFELDGELLD